MKKIMTRLLSLVLLGAFIPSFVLAETWYLENGDITVNAAPDKTQTVSQRGTTTPDPSPVISTHAPDSTQTGAVEKTVTINAEANATANVTLENVNIDIGYEPKAAITTEGKGDVTLNLSGNNSVQSGTYHAGVHKENTGNLTVTAPEGGTGSLKAIGGDGGAGIGGGAIDGNGNNITISGGTVDAKGGEYSAGIGGGGNSSDNNASKITISGGNVTATGGGSAAGIGGGNGGSGTDIEITGGIVAANGGEQGAGIGGGKYGDGSGITVSGGTVNATGKDNVYGGGAGIGGGSGGNGSDITISGGEVTANGGDLTANGGIGGAGIGGGNGGSGNGITVSGGKVTANGGIGGAGIGGGNGDSGNGITVSGGEVTAKGGTFGAGIGGGGSVSGQGNGSNIKIDGGQVTAQGGLSGAGIGGGQSSNGSGIKISGDAQVKAQGGAEYKGLLKEGAAIGNGGTDTQKGDELDMDQVASGLSVDGFIQTYKPDDNIDTAKPENLTIGTSGDHSWNEGTVTTQPTCTTPGVKTYTCTNTAHTSPITKTESIPALNHDFKTYIYDNNATCTQDGTETAKCDHGCGKTDTRTVKGTKLPGDTAETAPENQAAPYWVSGPEGQSLPYQAQIKDGVLTVTVQADTASLRGTTESFRQLEAQGITGIRFATNRAQSDFALSDLLTSGTGSFTLTHDGDKVTFTLESTDISGILK